MVSPDMASKNAPVKLRSGSASSSGSAAAPGRSSQPSVSSRKPSRAFSARRGRSVAPASTRPQPAVSAAANRNFGHRPSPMSSEQPTGRA